LRKLKVIQSLIKDKILVPITLPDNIHGGVKGKNNVTNAKPHQGKKYKFTTDLQNFYPSIKHKQVYNTFILLGYSDHLAHWLTKLTTWKYELPQGTPTSTHIANLVFLETDKKLIELAERHNLTYTRYVDDLTFSSQQDFKSILNDILNIVQESGFNISYRKTKYSGNQVVTGIEIFNNSIDVPKKIKVKAKEEKLSGNSIKPYTNYLEMVRRTNRKK
jgi:RNA-directed DNA polymerase